MKQIKKLLFVGVLALITSCSNDDFGPVEGTLTPTTQIEVSFSDANNGQTVTESEMITYTVALSNEATQNLTVEFTVSSSDGTTDTNGEEVTFTNPLVIPAGTTSVDLPVTFNDDMVLDTAETYTITISNVTPTLPDAYILLGDATRTAVVEQAPAVVTTTAGDVKVSLGWTAARDMDLHIFDGAPTDPRPPYSSAIYSSAGSANPETVIYQSSRADGVYSVFINQWAFTADVDYTMTFDFPDGQQLVYDSTVTMDSYVFTMEKVTNGSDVTYTIVQL